MLNCLRWRLAWIERLYLVMVLGKFEFLLIMVRMFACVFRGLVIRKGSFIVNLVLVLIHKNFLVIRLLLVDD